MSGAEGQVTVQRPSSCGGVAPTPAHVPLPSWRSFERAELPPTCTCSRRVAQLAGAPRAPVRGAGRGRRRPSWAPVAASPSSRSFEPHSFLPLSRDLLLPRRASRRRVVLGRARARSAPKGGDQRLGDQRVVGLRSSSGSASRIARARDRGRARSSSTSSGSRAKRNAGMPGLARAEVVAGAAQVEVGLGEREPSPCRGASAGAACPSAGEASTALVRAATDAAA